MNCLNIQTSHRVGELSDNYNNSPGKLPKFSEFSDNSRYSELYMYGKQDDRGELSDNLDPAYQFIKNSPESL